MSPYSGHLFDTDGTRVFIRLVTLYPDTIQITRLDTILHTDVSSYWVVSVSEYGVYVRRYFNCAVSYVRIHHTEIVFKLVQWMTSWWTYVDEADFLYVIF